MIALWSQRIDQLIVFDRIVIPSIRHSKHRCLLKPGCWRMAGRACFQSAQTVIDSLFLPQASKQASKPASKPFHEVQTQVKAVCAEQEAHSLSRRLSLNPLIKERTRTETTTEMEMEVNTSGVSNATEGTLALRAA